MDRQFGGGTIAINTRHSAYNLLRNGIAHEAPSILFSRSNHCF